MFPYRMELLKINKDHKTSHNILQNQLHDKLLAIYSISPTIRYTTTPAKEHFLDYVCSNPHIQLNTSNYQIHLISVTSEIIMAVVKRLSFVIWPQSVTSQETILFKRNLHNGSITVNPILFYS